MKHDKLGRQVLTEQDLCDLYLKDPKRSVRKAFVENNIKFDDDLNISNKPELELYQILDIDKKTFDQQNQNTWFMPENYKNLDIAKFLLDQCKTQEELQRVGQELIEFEKRDMFMLLRYLKYLVDTMRKHKVVWGVGRGSSVSSYVLYLIGVHRINSLHYDLSIDEFLK